MAYADVSDVTLELGSNADEFTNEELERFLRKANRLVQRRLPTERDEQHLADMEALAAAHLAYGRLTGGVDGGEVISSIEQQSAAISYETDHLGPGDYSSPYWNEAVHIDQRMANEGSFWSVTL